MIGRASAALLAFLAAVAARAEPTVVAPAGDGRLAARLRGDPGVAWVLEFGTELLVGLRDRRVGDTLLAAGGRSGPELAREEILVRERVCPDADPRPALTQVGGFEILRVPPALRRSAERVGRVLPLPADGALARPVAAHPGVKRGRAPDAAVAAIVGRIDAERWHATMASLAGISRHSYGSGIEAAHDAILLRFAKAGLATESHAYTLSTSCGSRPARNPVGIKPGRVRPEEWIVIGAHYDSRNEQPCDASLAPAPGANDNASGCAGVIELAIAFASVATDRSLVFVCFSGEEQGLHGSRAFVQTLVADGRIAGVRHMVNLDMIGHAVDASLAARAETRAEFASWLALYGQAAATYAPELGLQLLQSTAAYSDHWPFLERGVPAVFTWENGASIYPHWHRSSDRPENMLRARELARGILRMDAAVIAELAGVWGLYADGFEAP